MSDTSSSEEIWRALLDRDVVHRLVREGLGCECPESVFDDIVVGRPAVFAGLDQRSAVQLLVGRRLLVSFVEIGELPALRVDAERLLRQGRELRDAQGLNRFRLVLVGRCNPCVVEELAARAVALDDRLHVHALEPEALLALTAR